MRTTRQSLAGLFACLSMAALAGGAAADEGPLMVRTARAQTKMIERESRLVDLPDNITVVTDFDDTVILVEAVSPTRVRVTALAPGVTSISFTDVNQIVRELEVFVTGDTRHLQAHLRELFPDSNVEAVAVGESVVLRGFVTQPSQIPQIVDVAGTFYGEVHNQIRVATDDRVVLYVKVAEVNRSKARQFGFNFIGAGRGGNIRSGIGGIGPASAYTEGTFNAFSEGVLQTPNIVGTIISGNGSEYVAFLEALKTENLLKILAEPNVTATSGRPATLLSGGEFPILIPQGIGQTSIQYREFGISIEAVPVVLGNGRIRLDIAPEVSDLDFANGVTLDGIRVPALSTRRVNTQAEMMFGETLVLGGLISTRRIGTTNKVPYLGDLPYIGAAFSRKSFEDTETELLIMVTPMPAAPFGPGECPPPAPGENTLSPTDKELYWWNMLEVPKYGDECNDGACQISGGHGSYDAIGGGFASQPAPFAGVPVNTATPTFAVPTESSPRPYYPTHGDPTFTAPTHQTPTFNAPMHGAGTIRRQAAPAQREGVFRFGGQDTASSGPARSGPVRTVSATR